MLGKIFRFYNKASWIFLIFGMLLTFGTAFYFIDIKPPRFGITLMDDITDNKALMSKIGGWKESQFLFSDSLAKKNLFKIIVIGNCDSSFVVIKGTYTNNQYIISDTALHRCK